MLYTGLTDWLCWRAFEIDNVLHEPCAIKGIGFKGLVDSA